MYTVTVSNDQLVILQMALHRQLTDCQAMVVTFSNDPEYLATAEADVTKITDLLGLLDASLIQGRHHWGVQS